MSPILSVQILLLRNSWGGSCERGQHSKKIKLELPQSERETRRHFRLMSSDDVLLLRFWELVTNACPTLSVKILSLRNSLGGSCEKCQHAQWNITCKAHKKIPLQREWLKECTRDIAAHETVHTIWYTSSHNIIHTIIIYHPSST